MQQYATQKEITHFRSDAVTLLIFLLYKNVPVHLLSNLSKQTQWGVVPSQACSVFGFSEKQIFA
jgi:hypothetical protein